MYPRTEYEMTEEDLKKILDACKPVPMIMLQCGTPRSPQERANAAWEELGKRMGFDHMTVRPVEGKSQRFFTAIPSETEEQQKARAEKEAEEKRQREIEDLRKEIREKQDRLKELGALH